MEFPAVHFETLYSIALLPVVATQYRIEPMFRLILNADDFADANFKPVSMGLTCQLTILFGLEENN